MHESNKDQSSF